jgi:hypothetical protein
MKNFLLGVLVALSLNSLAVTYNPDGSVILSKEESNDVQVAFYQLNYNFNLAVERVAELSKQVEKLEKLKCI